MNFSHLLSYDTLGYLLEVGLGVLGIYTATLLRTKTKSKCSLLILIGSVLKILMSLAYPITLVFHSPTTTNFENFQRIWMALWTINMVSISLLTSGLVLLAKEFCALFDLQQLQETIRRDQSQT